MIRRLGVFSARHSIWVLALWVIAAVVLTVTAPSLSKVGVQDETAFLPASSPSLQAEHVIEKLFPGDPSFSSAVIVLSAAHGLGTKDNDYIGTLDRYLLSSALKGAGVIVESPETNPALASMLVSRDHTTALVIVGMQPAPFTTASTAVVTKIRDFIARSAPGGLTHHVSGVAGLGTDEATGVTSSFGTVGIFAALLVMLILFWVYRRVWALLVPLGTIAVGFGVAQGVIGVLAAHGFKVASLAATFMIVIVFGAGTDYCLFVVSRFREQLQQGSDVPEAIGEAMGKIGPVVVASAATVILGFSSLTVARFGLYKTMGPAIGLAVAVTLLASLTFTPAMLSLLGNKVASTRRVRTQGATGSAGSDPWRRLGTLVTGRPLLVILVPTLALTGCCAGLFALHQSFNIVTELPTNSDSRIGYNVLSQHFPPGELAPLEIAVNGPHSIISPGSLDQIDRLTDTLRHLRGVAQVRSVTQPLGAPITPALLTHTGGLGAFDAGLSQVQVAALTAQAHSPEGLRFTGTLLADNAGIKRDLGYFLGDNGRSTRIEVTLSGNPYGPGAIAVTRTIGSVVDRSLAGGSLAGARVVVGGPSVAFGDIQLLASGDLILIIVVVLVLVFLVLVLLLRALIAPLYLVATVVLSYGAALGVTAFVFTTLLGQGALSFWVPPFLFVILVALGADYTVFVMGRIKEARRSGLDVPQAAVEGLVSSGPVISAAGLILAGTFLALLLTPLPPLREVGFAVGFGVLVDTFVVRPLLVPALTSVAGTWAFWPGERTSRRPVVRWGTRRWVLALGGVGLVAVTAAGIAVAISPSGHVGPDHVIASARSAPPKTPSTLPSGQAGATGSAVISGQTSRLVEPSGGPSIPAVHITDVQTAVSQPTGPSINTTSTVAQPTPPNPLPSTTSPPAPTGPSCDLGIVNALVRPLPGVTALLCGASSLLSATSSANEMSP